MSRPFVLGYEMDIEHLSVISEFFLKKSKARFTFGFNVNNY